MKSSFDRKLKFQIKVDQSQIMSIQYVIKVTADRKLGITTTAVLAFVGWADIYKQLQCIHDSSISCLCQMTFSLPIIFPDFKRDHTREFKRDFKGNSKKY